MKYASLICAAAIVGVCGTAVADPANGPVVMNDAQMDQVVGSGTINVCPAAFAGCKTLFEDVGTGYNISPGNHLVNKAGPPASNDGQGMVNGCNGAFYCP